MNERSQPIRVNRRSFLKSSAVAGASAGVQAATAAVGNDSRNPITPHATPSVIHHSPAAVDDAPNPIVAENRMPGTPNWGITQLYNDIEGYASETSLVAGDSLTFFVNTPAATFDLLIYRAGYYGGIGARLMAEVRGLAGGLQSPVARDDLTGFASCASWSPSHQMIVPDGWVTGIYIAKLVRHDTGGEGCIYFTLRENEAAEQSRGGRGSDVLLQQSVTTYQAYNPYGGKSLYAFNSSACQTVSEGQRAVKVSFDRPYIHPLFGQNHFFLSDFPVVYWLEAHGYDVSYCTSIDTHRSGKPDAKNLLLNHRAFLSVGHDEYWSQEIHDAVTTARDSKVNIAFLSSNTSYWRVRLEPDPRTGRPDRVMCCYKTAESGAPDPISPTSTFRDPAINQPENSLIGVQYVGDNDMHFFPIRVSAEQGKDRIYRHTPLAQMEPGRYTDLGRRLVGWEWDAVVDNGFGPANLTVLASTPVYGNVLDDAGRRYITGKAVSNVTRYTASSGAIVFATGTNQWGWGLSLLDPNPVVQQVMCNVLADMGALPATSDRTLVLDEPTPAVSRHSFINGTQTEFDFMRVTPQAKYGLWPADPAKAYPDRLSAVEQQPEALPVISNVNIALDRISAAISFDTDVDTIGQFWLRIVPTTSDYRLSAELGWRLPTAASGISEPYARRHELVAQSLELGQSYYVTIIVVDQHSRVTILDERRIETAAGNALDALKAVARTLSRSLPCWMRQNWSAAAAGLAAVVAVSGVAWRSRRVRRKSNNSLKR